MLVGLILDPPLSLLTSSAASSSFYFSSLSFFFSSEVLSHPIKALSTKKHSINTEINKCIFHTAVKSILSKHTVSLGPFLFLLVSLCSCTHQQQHHERECCTVTLTSSLILELLLHVCSHRGLVLHFLPPAVSSGLFCALLFRLGSWSRPTAALKGSQRQN